MPLGRAARALDPRFARAFPYGSSDAMRFFAQGKKLLPLVAEEGDFWPPDSGVIVLNDRGCGIVDCIVVSGEQRGRMWQCDMGWAPLELGFLDWYEAWLIPRD